MARTVAIVHNDPRFQRAASVALRNAGCDVVSYISPMTALDEIEAGQHSDVLVTRVTFPAGEPNGASLALVLRTKYPGLKVVFAARAEQERHVKGIGELIPHPVNLEKLVEAVLR